MTFVRTFLNPFRAIALGLALAVIAPACGGGGGTGPDPDNNNLDGDGTVGPNGGLVGIGDDAQIIVPPGALSQDVEIRITPVATPADLVAEGAIGQAYRYDPIALTFVSGVRILIEVPAGARGARPLTDVTIRRSTLVTTALTPAGELLSNIQHGNDDVSGTTNRLGVFSAALPPIQQNQNPNANAGVDLAGTTGTAVNLNGSGTDPDGDTVTFAWTFTTRPAGSAAALTNANTATPSFTPDVAGTYVVQLTTSDGRGGTATDSATITVTTPGGGNRAPVANAGTDQAVSVGTAVQLNGNGSSDPDPNTTLTFSWRIVASPGGSPVINNANAAQASFVPNQTGDYLVELTVSDGALADRDTVRITAAQANRAPTLTVNLPNPVFPGGQLSIDAQAFDPDGDPVQITFDLVDRPAGSSATIDASGTIVADRAGEYRVRVRATDSGGLFAEQDVSVFANAQVAGNYDVNIQVNGSGPVAQCNVNESQSGVLPISQPSPGTVILNLPGASDQFLTTAVGTLEGEAFSFSGPIRVKVGQDEHTVQGTVNGTITQGGQLDLTANFTVIVCSVTARITGNRQ